MNTTLRLTDTNNGSDSGGRTWGLDGNLVWWVIGGLGGGIAVFFVATVALNTAFVPSLAGGLAPIILVLAYVFVLRQGKPPGYDLDLLESLLLGSGFAPPPRSLLRLTLHPLAS